MKPSAFLTFDPAWSGRWALPRPPGGWKHRIMMWNGMATVGWLWMVLGTVLSVMVVVLVVLAVVWLARNLGASGGRPNAGGSLGPGAARTARETLDLRYARGEISRDEYLEARDDLEDRPS